MVATPWGESATLRQRRLQPTPGTDRAEVERKQRERLFAAMVACVAEKGYARTTVSNLVELSGVSSRSFYDFFGSKAGCMAETVREVVLLLTCDLGGGPSEDLEAEARAVFKTLAQRAITQPAASKVCLNDAFAAGPEALTPMMSAVASFEKQAKERLESTPEREGVPSQLISARLGGILEVARARLQSGSQDELPELVEDLVALLLADRPPRQPLRLGVRPGKAPPENLDAPDPRERAIRAFAMVVAEQGYQETSVTDVVKRAGMSARTFYAHFSGKEDVAGAAIESICSHLVAVATVAFGRHAEWPAALRAGIGESLNLLASRPALAHLVIVDVHAAGEFALERRKQALAPLRMLFENNTTAWLNMPSVIYEVLAGGIGWLLFEEVTRGGVETLFSLAPVCTYLLLSPFIGTEEATVFANDAGRKQRASGDRRYWERALGSGSLPFDSAMKISTFRALALLARRSATTAEVAEAIGEDIEAVRTTIEALESAGVVEVEPATSPTAETRFRQRFEIHRLNLISRAQTARLTQEEREEVSADIWGLMRKDVERSFSSRLFDARVERLMASTPLHVDAEGWRELLDLHEMLVRAGLSIQARSIERMNDSGEKGFRVSSHQLAFEIPSDPESSS
jgi:AcrR family transcriptional regulator/DNA-binding transcriptional ArsR family regulator